VKSIDEAIWVKPVSHNLAFGGARTASIAEGKHDLAIFPIVQAHCNNQENYVQIEHHWFISL